MKSDCLGLTEFAGSALLLRYLLRWGLSPRLTQDMTDQKSGSSLMARVKRRVVFFGRMKSGLPIRPLRAVFKGWNVFGTPLQKDLGAGISERLLKCLEVEKARAAWGLD